MRYLPLVNTKQGSLSSGRFSNGNTLPFTQLPFAMAGFVPQTSIANQPWFYNPQHRSLEGVRLTHQATVWFPDYGAVLLMPQTGSEPQSEPDKYWSSYRPQEALLAPDYMKLYFARYGVTFELAPTERGGVFRLNYPVGKRPYLSILNLHGKCSYRIDVENSRIYGSTDAHGMDKAEGFCQYFVIQFDKNVLDAENTRILENAIHIALASGEIEAQIAISYIGGEQALLNLRQEQTDFAAARADASLKWEERLSKIEVEANTEDEMRTFYSCMYRAHLFPHKAYEIDESRNPVHYSPHDGKTRSGVRYTDTGFWDTARTQFPLLSIIAKDDYAEMLEGFINDYTEGGWLPRWPAIGENGCMPSTHIDAVIADAAAKGIISGELLEKAFEGMLHHANNESADDRFGRSGVAAYVRYGYVPYSAARHSVNRTLDDAYGDFCIAQAAKVLEHTDLEAVYRKRAENYKNLFDPSTGFMRGKDAEGNMRDAFDPFDWGGDYCEGGAWQNSFYVPHDTEGFAALHGGKENLIAKLDELFATPPRYNTGAYGIVIHEMAEMAEADFGQCAMSNQPSFHIPYLYAALGQPEKTDYWVEKICRELFSYKDDGFPGDEDNGSMAAWYIFAMLGLYPLCPGKPEFVKSKMLMKSARIHGVKWSREGQKTAVEWDKI